MSSAPALRSKYDGIVFLNTYTRMKIHNYRIAARFQNENCGRSNILVVAAHQLARVKSAIENTGTTAGNSRQKVDEAAIFIELYNTEPQFRAHVQAFCRDAGLDFSEDKVILAGDDTCLYLPENVWRAFKQTEAAKRSASHLIDEADNEFVQQDIAGGTWLFRGPGVNTTYFISSMGIRAYRDALYQSGQTAGFNENYPILRRTTLSARRLSEKENISKIVGTSIIQLIDPHHPNRFRFPHELHSDNAFLSEYGRPGTPISSFMNVYEGEKNSYARAFVGLLDTFFPQREPIAQPRTVSQAGVGHIRWLKVQEMGDGEKQVPIQLESFKGPDFKAAPPLDTASPMSLLNLDPFIAGADAFVLGIPPTKHDLDLRWWAYVMFSLIVAIKTHPRDAEKIAIIMVDKSALRFAQLYFDLANEGWTDDFPVLTEQQENFGDEACGIRHVRTGLVHFLIANDLDHPFPRFAAEVKANAILRKHQGIAFRLRAPFNEYPVGPTALEAAALLEPANVSFMCTSHSERDEVHRDCTSIGNYLAQNGMSATWPGNDRNNMRSLYNALTQCPRLIGVITPHLADAATWNGKIPDCTTPIMASHIYERTLLLIILGQCHIIFPVGVGGILEISCRLLADDHFREFRIRPAIFYSPDYASPGPSATGFMGPIATALLGESGWRRMMEGEYIDSFGNRRAYSAASTLERVFTLLDNYLATRVR